MPPTTGRGSTGLGGASAYGHLDATKHVLDCGANLNIQPPHQGPNSVEEAYDHGHSDIL